MWLASICNFIKTRWYHRFTSDLRISIERLKSKKNRLIIGMYEYENESDRKILLAEIDRIDNNINALLVLMDVSKEDYNEFLLK